MKKNKEQLEKDLIEMTEAKRNKDKQLLYAELIIGCSVIATLFTCIFIATSAEIKSIFKIILMICGIIEFVTAMIYCLKIEQTVGYYECDKCHHKYIPTYSSVFWAMHMGRTRYMKCPKCNQKSWQKKVISKNIRRK